MARGTRQEQAKSRKTGVWIGVVVAVCVIGAVVAALVLNAPKNYENEFLYADVLIHLERDEPELEPDEETEDNAEDEEIYDSRSPEERAVDLLSSMTLTEQVYQMFIVAPEQLTGETKTTTADKLESALKEYPVGGLILFSANIEDPDQCTKLISDSQDYSKTNLFISVDEEGGTVARIGNKSNMGTTKFPNMESIGDTGNTYDAYDVGYVIGSEISQFGFNLDFAPVADIDLNEDSVIGSRAFSSDAVTAGQMVYAAVSGFRDSGVMCSLKHFPGHGGANGDSHKGYTLLDKSLDELWNTEFIPFEMGIEAQAPLVMVGHISDPQVTGDDTPASLSKTMIDILKQDLGFPGLVITDSLNMSAITDNYSSGEAAVLAVKAGVDILLTPANLQEAADSILAALEDGTILPEEIRSSVLKILTMKIQYGII